MFQAGIWMSIFISSLVSFRKNKSTILISRISNKNLFLLLRELILRCIKQNLPSLLKNKKTINNNNNSTKNLLLYTKISKITNKNPNLKVFH